VRFRTPLILARWPHEADAALEMLEGNLDAPTQSIERTDCRKRIFIAIERRDEMIHSAAISVPGRKLRPLSRAWRLSLSIERSRACLGLRIATQPQCDGLFRRTLDPDGAIDKPLTARLFEKRDESEAVCLAVKPARVVPPGPHHDVEHLRDPVTLKTRAIAHAGFARDPIDDLTFALIPNSKAVKRSLADQTPNGWATGRRFHVRPAPVFATDVASTSRTWSALGRSHAGLALARTSTDQLSEPATDPPRV